jgi:hypothetical protein
MQEEQLNHHHAVVANPERAFKHPFVEKFIMCMKSCLILMLLYFILIQRYSIAKFYFEILEYFFKWRFVFFAYITTTKPISLFVFYVLSFFFF